MAEVIRVLDDPILLDGMPYAAQVCGRVNGHVWEGWIEFAAIDGSDRRRTPRETTQPDRDALIYWSEGLSGTYLEGALARTWAKERATVRDTRVPFFDEPAGAPPAHASGTEPPPEADRAVLDPFSVGAKGEELLRRELGALADWHLRNIIRAYDLVGPSIDLERRTGPELIEMIVAAVQPA